MSVDNKISRPDELHEGVSLAVRFEYATVYLMDLPFCVDSGFDYFIPLELRDRITEGSFVTLPFGKGNRKQMAVVRRLHHCPGERETKPISALCSDRAPLSGEALELCDYMKEQYLCTYGEAIRAMIPAPVLGKMAEHYYPVQGKGPDASAGYSPADLFVYEYIVSRGGRTKESIKTKFGSAVAEEAIQKLLARGYITRELVSTKSMGGVYVSYCNLRLDRSVCADIVEGRGEIKLRSQLHRAIISELLRCEDELACDVLSEKLGATAAQFKALEEKGIIEITKRKVWRQDFANADTEQTEYKLNNEQKAAADEIKKRISSGEASAVLLHGVTGSGKTSVIMAAIDEALKCGKGVIMLLPEIALTPQSVKIFSARYKERVALVHSGLSAGERCDAYNKIKNGEADLVIGTRSAIFSPVKDLGLVIIDEEHETTYKSDTSPKYHARDIARWRCAKSGAVMLLSSATPSLESYLKAKEGKYTLLKLKERYGNSSLPEVIVYDMRNEVKQGNTSPIGRVLKEELLAAMERDEQAVLFLNRRGYNTSVSCKSCGETLSCPNCSISLNYHTKNRSYDKGFLFCHWCGYKAEVPKECPKCGSEHLAKIGFGTQRIEQEISELIPNKTVLRMDADSTSKKDSLETLLKEFKERSGDLLLGTQMVTKGHDFPNVTLVGVLLADMSLYMDDYHANERTFSMLTQVIGRAGRSEKKGKAIIQTNNPDNDTIRLACRQDYEAFFESEIRLRKLLVFPPYCDIALLTLTCTNEKELFVASARLRQELDSRLGDRYSDVQTVVYGPFEAPVFKVEGKFRMRLVIKCRLNRRSRELFRELLIDYGKGGKDRAILSVDFNPTGI